MAAPRIAVVIPALNEAAALPRVLAEIPQSLDARVVVVDNGSTDGTAAAARAAGAEVVSEQQRGYGSACQAGLAALGDEPPEIVVILDADHSDYPEDIVDVVAPIAAGRADFVCGSRVERAEPGALPPHVRWGNALATRLIRLLHGRRFTDMGPLRALRWSALKALRLREPNYGWNAEMQVKAVQQGFEITEVPVRYRRRVGRSKISGTVRGTVLAGSRIIWTIVTLWLSPATLPVAGAPDAAYPRPRTGHRPEKP